MVEVEAGAEPEVEKPKNKPGSQKWREKAERAKEEAEHWKAVALSGAKPEPAKPVQAEGKPQLEQFQTHSDWVEAVTDWKVDQKLKQRETEANNAKIVQSWNEKKAEARKDIPDLDEVLDEMETPSPVASSIIYESDQGPRIAHYLGLNPDELREINRMTPPKAALAVARIEARLAPPKPTSKKVSEAPPPPKPVTASVSSKATPDTRLEVY